MAVARKTLDRFTSMKSNGSALPLYAPMEPTATAQTDAEPVPTMAALKNGFPADKCGVRLARSWRVCRVLVQTR
jgi:hypothetical protein